MIVLAFGVILHRNIDVALKDIKRVALAVIGTRWSYHLAMTVSPGIIHQSTSSTILTARSMWIDNLRQFAAVLLRLHPSVRELPQSQTQFQSALSRGRVTIFANDRH